MKASSLRFLLSAAAFGVAALAHASDAPSNPAWGKAADNKILAQAWVNKTMAANSDLLVIGVHAFRPGTQDERMIASNLDRINKEDDDDDKGAVAEGKTVLAPNMKDPNKFEVLMPLTDSKGAIIGAIGFVFRYQKGESQINMLTKATALRDGFGATLSGASDLFKPTQ